MRKSLQPLNLAETAANSGVFTAMVPGAVPDRFNDMIEGSSDLGGVGAAASDGTLLARIPPAALGIDRCLE